MTDSRIVYSTDTNSAAETRRREMEGILVTCPSCEEERRLFVATPPTGYWLCGRCQDD